MSNTIEITLKVTIPDQLDATSDEIEEFIEFELGTSASLSGNNPRDDPGYADYLYEQQRDRDKEQVDEH